MKKQLTAGILLSLISGSVYAHSGNTGHSFMSGFFHPFLGLDHVLVMLAIGLWAYRVGGAARWQLPIIFVLVMVASALAANGISPNIEIWVAASVMAMGLILCLNFPMKNSLQLSLTVIFAMVHGFAHGAELPVAFNTQVLFGMMLATALLHGIGMLIALLQIKMRHNPYKVIGWMTFLAGGYAFIATSS